MSRPTIAGLTAENEKLEQRVDYYMNQITELQSKDHFRRKKLTTFLDGKIRLDYLLMVGDRDAKDWEDIFFKLGELAGSAEYPKALQKNLELQQQLKACEWRLEKANTQLLNKNERV